MQYAGVALALLFLVLCLLSSSTRTRDTWTPSRPAKAAQLAFVLLPEARLPSGDDIVRDYAAFGPASDRIRLVGPGSPPADEPAVELALGNGDQAFVGLVPHPIPGGEAEDAARLSLGSMRDGFTFPAHGAHLTILLRSTDDATPLQRVQRFTSLIAAVIRASGAVGVYWGAARVTHEAAFFTETAASPDPIPRLFLWTGLSVGREADGRVSLLSHGMNQLDLPDLFYVTPGGADMGTIQDFFNILAYLVDLGRPIPEGDTVGFSETQRLRVRYVPSPAYPDERVWRLDAR